MLRAGEVPAGGGGGGSSIVVVQKRSRSFDLGRFTFSVRSVEDCRLAWRQGRKCLNSRSTVSIKYFKKSWSVVKKTPWPTELVFTTGFDVDVDM